MNGLPTISRRRCTQEASASVVLHCRPGVEAESICQFLPGPLCLDSKQEEGLDLDLESSELYIVGSWSGWTKMERMERKGSGRWVSKRRQSRVSEFASLLFGEPADLTEAASWHQ